MSNPIIPTESYKFTEARPRLSELLNRVFRLEARMLISKGDIPVAAIVSVGDLERLNKLDAERAADFAIFDQIAAKFQDQSVEDIERAVARRLIRSALRNGPNMNWQEAIPRMLQTSSGSSRFKLHQRMFDFQRY